MKPIRHLALIALSLLVAGPALAKGTPKTYKPPVDEFKKLDKDHDGMLSKEEFMASGKGASADEFTKLDKNKDGKLDHYEFSLLHKKH